MKKYLLLAQPEEDFPEQFSSHMFLIMEAIFLAKKLGRVFVLPNLHSHPRNSTLCESGETDHAKFVLGKINYLFESIFDINMLSQYIEVVTFSEFSQISNGQLSCLYMFNNEHVREIDIYGKNFSFQKSIRLDNIYKITESDDTNIALTGCRRRQHTEKSSPNWHINHEMDYWEIRTSLRYKDTYINAANSFIKTHIGKKFVGVHWRRGDRVHSELGKDKEDIISNKKVMGGMLNYYLVQPIQSILRSYGLNKVFLATNSGTEWHLEYLRKHLPIVQSESSGILENLLMEGIVEQMICAQANFYFSSPYRYDKCSSFSRWIIDERRIIGKGKNISYQEKMRNRGISFFAYHTLITSTKKLCSSIIRKVGILPLFWKIHKLYKHITGKIRTTYVQIYIGRKNIKKQPKNTTRAVLFDNRFATITSNSIENSGSWNSYLDNMAIASDHHLIKKLHEILSQLTSPVLFDIGANTGSFSLLPYLNKTMTVYAFEPSPTNYQLLNNNIALNNIEKNVRTFNLALAQKIGRTILHTPKEQGYSGLATLGVPKRFKRATEIQVDLTTLDEFVRTNNTFKIDFIKIDTEGSELQVLHGGEKTIQKYMPTLLIELDAKNTRQCGYEPEEIIKLLSSWNYNIQHIDAGNILCVKKK